MRIIHILTVFLLFLAAPAFSEECPLKTDVYSAVDISTGRELKLVCDADSKDMAEVYLAKQKTDGCFVSKEQGEELYHVFCPVSIATESRN